jgi:hypothetical protein
MRGQLVIAVTVRSIFAERCNCCARIISAQGAATPPRKSGRRGRDPNAVCGPVVLILLRGLIFPFAFRNNLQRAVGQRSLQLKCLLRRRLPAYPALPLRSLRPNHIVAVMQKRRSREEGSRPKQFLRYTGPLMTLGNMRSNGVHSLDVTCGSHFCNHQGIVDVSNYPEDVPVPAFSPRMVCTVCGAIGADARPNWNERQAIGSFMGR